MKCPVDRKELEEISDNGIEHYECPTCKGVWMTDRALRAIVAQIDPDAAFALPLAVDRPSRKRDTSEALIKCPLDGIGVHKHKLGKVAVDICPVCAGIWLNPGEFDAVKEELEKHELLNAFDRPLIHAVAHLMHYHWADKSE